MNESATQEPWHLALIHGTTAVPKAVGKLIETLAGQIDLLAEPTHIRRIGAAQDDKRINAARADAIIDEIKLRSEIKQDGIAVRAAERLVRQEYRRQENLESIAQQAAEELPENVSADPVDPDWTAQWITNCQDVSDELMRAMWARILAREVAQPGSFSRESLSIAHILDKADAELFTRFCSAVWITADGPTSIVFPSYHNDPLNAGFDFDEMRRLEELRLVRFAATGSFSLLVPTEPHTWSYHGQSHVMHRYAPTPGRTNFPLDTGSTILTKAGREIFGLVAAMPNESYRRRWVELVRGQGWTLELQNAEAAANI